MSPLAVAMQAETAGLHVQKSGGRRPGNQPPQGENLFAEERRAGHSGWAHIDVAAAEEGPRVQVSHLKNATALQSPEEAACDSATLVHRKIPLTRTHKAWAKVKAAFDSIKCHRPE